MKTLAITESTKAFLQNAIETVVAHRPFESGAAQFDMPQPAPARMHLTRRQLDVLELLCEGMTNKDISRKLAIGNATVKIHVSSILRALNVTSRLQAAIAGRRLGLVKDKDSATESGAKLATCQPLVLRVMWDGTTAQIIGVDEEVIA